MRILLNFDWQLAASLILVKVRNALQLNASMEEKSTSEMGIWVKTVGNIGYHKILRLERPISKLFLLKY